MDKVLDSGIDGTVQDTPVWSFYAKRYPELQPVGGKVSGGEYVMYLRRDDVEIRNALNQELRSLIKNGDLAKLYWQHRILSPQEKLWDAAELPDDASDIPPSERLTILERWGLVGRDMPILLQAAWMTVKLSCLSMPLAMAIGMLVAIGRLYGPAPLRWLLSIYVEVLRGTPLMLQLYALFFVLPAYGFKLDYFTCAIVGLAVNYSAYESEIYRAGFLAIPAGQMEASLALGMSRLSALGHIIVPQVVRLSVPPVVSDFTALFKDTSICSVITVMELTKRYSILSNSTEAHLELASMTALLYLLMSYPVALLSRYLEKRMPSVSV
jgi:polar amino acid transport system substrate-binding protein